MRKLTLLFTIITFCALSVVAQKGTIEGTVVEIIDGSSEPLPFANIVVLDINGAQIAGGNTDFDGVYTITVDEGKYFVEASYIGYSPIKQELNVFADEKTVMNFELMAGIMVDDIELSYKKNDEGEGIVETIEIQQKSQGVTVVTGSAAMAKQGVSNASGAVAKVTGVSRVGNKNVFVRGMGDRYNSAYLNGLPMPSPDPDLKVVPLNLFPTAVIKNIGIDKTYSADKYGDYAGGAISINTKDFPGEFLASVSYGMSMNTMSTFKPFNSYNGGSNDFFGFDDGTRSLPISVENSESYNSLSSEGVGNPFKTNLNSITQNAPMNTSFSFQVGDYYQSLGEEGNGKIGYLITGSFRNGYTYNNGMIRTINFQDDVKLDYTFEKWNYTTSSSVLSNLFFSPRENQTITYNFLLINTSNDENRETRGTHFDYDDVNIYSVRQTYRQNTLMVNQLRGEHKLPSIFNAYVDFAWAGSFSKAMSMEPDRKQLIYLYQDGVAENEYTFNAIDRLDNHRFFSDLSETEITAKAELKFANFTEKTDSSAMPSLPFTLKAGFNQKIKSRVFDYRQFIYDVNNLNAMNPNGVDYQTPDDMFTEDNHGANGYYILEVGNAASRNDISQSIIGAYALANMEFSEKFKLISGLRFESSYQDIIFRNQQSPSVIEKPIILALDFLPHLNVKYNISDDRIFRFAGSRTVSRPGFKEVAPFEYTEVFAGVKTRGNPELQNGINNNLDVRYEVYKDWGTFSLGAFGKYLQNPIERTMLATASGQLQSFQNSKAAQVAGLEVEYISELKFDTTDSWKNNFNVGFNASYLYSKVIIDTAATLGGSTILTNLERPLQGASPYLVNFDIGYKFKKFGTDGFAKRETNLTLAYNVYGRRVFSAGIQGIGDQYELPVQTLNLTIRNKFYIGGLPKLALNLSVKNILNPMINIVQVSSLTGEEMVINNYQRGIGAGFSLKYTITGKPTFKKDEE